MLVDKYNKVLSLVKQFFNRYRDVLSVLCGWKTLLKEKIIFRNVVVSWSLCLTGIYS